MTWRNPGGNVQWCPRCGHRHIRETLTWQRMADRYPGDYRLKCRCPRGHLLYLTDAIDWPVDPAWEETHG